MKFYVNDGVEIELSPEVSQNIMVVKDTTFWHNKLEYTVRPVEFKIEDVYFFFALLIKNNPNKKIFVHHFEPLANNFYAMYFAIEV
jgi:hypothetical protein